MNTENRNNEDYTGIEKFFIIIFWFMQYAVGEHDLKEKGYVKKYRSRNLCIVLGIMLYSLIILLANLLEFLIS